MSQSLQNPALPFRLQVPHLISASPTVSLLLPVAFLIHSDFSLSVRLGLVITGCFVSLATIQAELREAMKTLNGGMVAVNSVDCRELWGKLCCWICDPETLQMV